MFITAQNGINFTSITMDVNTAKLVTIISRLQYELDSTKRKLRIEEEEKEKALTRYDIFVISHTFIIRPTLWKMEIVNIFNFLVQVELYSGIKIII